MSFFIRLFQSMIAVFLFSFMASAQNSDLKWTENVGAKHYPTNTKSYNAADYGAKPDGKTLNTIAIQKTIDACASNGGGIVTFKPGSYLTGSIFLKENVNLEIPKGVTILGSTDLKDYPEADSRIAGVEMRWPSALINVIGQKRVVISGDGVVNGQGKVFWDSYWTMRKEYEKKGLRWIVDYDCKRARTLLVSESIDVTIKGVTFQQAGFWTIQLLYSSFCTVDGVVIQNNIGGAGPSTDGIDIDSSSNILVQNCDIDCNDDNFCLKAGRDADGLRVNRPTEYVVIRNCISRAGGGLLTCGSETSGGIRYVLAENLKAKGTLVGIRLKSAMNRGGTTEHIYVRNIEMDGVGLVFEATMNWNPAYSYSVLPKEYQGKKLPDHWTKMLEKVDPERGTPYFKNIYLSDFKVTQSKEFMNVGGRKNSLMRNFNFTNIRADVESIGKITYAADWKFENIDVRAKDKASVKLLNSEGVQFPLNKPSGGGVFPSNLKKESQSVAILVASHPEFAFKFPEMAGNLRFGIGLGEESKWLNDLIKNEVKEEGNKLIYTLSDPLLANGKIIITALSLSQTDGLLVQIKGENIPKELAIYWSYGGASGAVLSNSELPNLQPNYCSNNVFSVENSAFTLYYGQSMQLKTVNGVMPLQSVIRLADAYVQNTPLALFESGKKTDAPVLAAKLPFNSAQQLYFCIYKQNSVADYNYESLPVLFTTECN